MTNAKLAILSLIVQQPRHGYEIERIIEEQGMREWTEVGFSSIYYVLNKLEKQGLITGQLVQRPGRGPARKVYQVTTAGRAAWQEATLAALSEADRCYPSLLLGLANIGGMPTDQVISALRQYQEKLEARRKHVRARWQNSEAHLPYFVAAMFEYSLTMVDAELGWVTQFIGQLVDQMLATQPPTAESGG